MAKKVQKPGDIKSKKSFEIVELYDGENDMSEIHLIQDGKSYCLAAGNVWDSCFKPFELLPEICKRLGGKYFSKPYKSEYEDEDAPI